MSLLFLRHSPRQARGKKHSSEGTLKYSPYTSCRERAHDLSPPLLLRPAAPLSHPPSPALISHAISVLRRTRTPAHKSLFAVFRKPKRLNTPSSNRKPSYSRPRNSKPPSSPPEYRGLLNKDQKDVIDLPRYLRTGDADERAQSHDVSRMSLSRPSLRSPPNGEGRGRRWLQIREHSSF